MNKIAKLLLIWAVVIGCLVAVNAYLAKSGQKQLSVSYTEMMNRVQDGQVKDVTIEETTLVGHFADNQMFRTTIPANDPGLYPALRDHGVNITVKSQNSSTWVSTLVSILPFALLLCLWYVILRLLLRLARLNHPEPPTLG